MVGKRFDEGGVAEGQSRGMQPQKKRLLGKKPPTQRPGRCEGCKEEDNKETSTKQREKRSGRRGNDLRPCKRAYC